MVATLTTIAACLQAIGTFAFEHVSALPTATATGLIEDLGLPSPVDKIVNGCERVWAIGLDTLAGSDQAAAATLCAQLAGFAVTQGWHALGATDRGPFMIGACRRILAEDGADQDPALDPVPIANFVPPEE